MATSAGRVSALQADVGSLVTVERPVAIVVGRGARLEARLYVPTESIGFVQIGQTATLLFNAFPYQYYGVGHGVVSEVSTVALAPDRVAAPIKLDDGTYRVAVRLDDEVLRAYGRRLRLMPGMTLTAEIVQDRRSIAQWLVDPILAARGRLF